MSERQSRIYTVGGQPFDSFKEAANFAKTSAREIGVTQRMVPWIRTRGGWAEAGRDLFFEPPPDLARVRRSPLGLLKVELVEEIRISWGEIRDADVKIRPYPDARLFLEEHPEVQCDPLTIHSAGIGNTYRYVRSVPPFGNAPCCVKGCEAWIWVEGPRLCGRHFQQRRKGVPLEEMDPFDVYGDLR